MGEARVKEGAKGGGVVRIGEGEGKGEGDGILIGCKSPLHLSTKDTGLSLAQTSNK